MVTAMGPATAGNTLATEKTTLETEKTTKAVAMALPTAETPQEQHDASKAGIVPLTSACSTCQREKV